MEIQVLGVRVRKLIQTIRQAQRRPARSSRRKRRISKPAFALSRRPGARPAANRPPPRGTGAEVPRARAPPRVTPRPLTALHFRQPPRPSSGREAAAPINPDDAEPPAGPHCRPATKLAAAPHVCQAGPGRRRRPPASPRASRAPTTSSRVEPRSPPSPRETPAAERPDADPESARCE